MLFREGVIGFFIGETKDEKKNRIEDKYCMACRAARKDVACNRCSKRIEVKDGGE